jgi:hypothetical protein
MLPPKKQESETISHQPSAHGAAPRLSDDLATEVIVAANDLLKVMDEMGISAQWNSDQRTGLAIGRLRHALDAAQAAMPAPQPAPASATSPTGVR